MTVPDEVLGANYERDQGPLRNRASGPNSVLACG